MVSVLAGTLGAGEAVTYGAPERTGHDQSARAQPQPQEQAQPRAVTEDEDFADMYTRTVANVRGALLGESVRRPGAGHLIQNPDHNAFQSIDIVCLPPTPHVGTDRLAQPLGSPVRH
ncbi:hypothetical protein [Streptomyces sp. NPDC058385]|uniref:hypothetical protein n=1 Tax=Streptomyces sp. NPDC058385 TaxID=3346473 RepID=UPI003668EB5A